MLLGGEEVLMVVMMELVGHCCMSLTVDGRRNERMCERLELQKLKSSNYGLEENLLSL